MYGVGDGLESTAVVLVCETQGSAEESRLCVVYGMGWEKSTVAVGLL